MLDFGELQRKYSKLYLGLEPLIVHNDLLKILCLKLESQANETDTE